MSVHLHRARQWTACMLGAAVVSPLAWGVGSPDLSGPSSDATGRVTYQGRPVGDMVLCLDQGDQHKAFGMLQPDGSFQLYGMNRNDSRVDPGSYRAHIYTYKPDPPIPSKYAKHSTSGISLSIAPGWNHICIELP